MEGPSKKDPTVLTGRTRQGKLVHFSPSGEPGAAPVRCGAGDMVQVRIDSAAPHHLRGTLVSGDAGRLPTARRLPIRIPVHAG